MAVVAITASGTRFTGITNFAHAEFDGHVHFEGARFEGGAGHFYGAWFGLRAVFAGTDFGEEEANFEAANFAGMASFHGAKLAAVHRWNVVRKVAS